VVASEAPDDEREDARDEPRSSPLRSLHEQQTNENAEARQDKGNASSETAPQ
jgi:hypothetical protein